MTSRLEKDIADYLAVLEYERRVSPIPFVPTAGICSIWYRFAGNGKFVIGGNWERPLSVNIWVNAGNRVCRRAACNGNCRPSVAYVDIFANRAISTIIPPEG